MQHTLGILSFARPETQEKHDLLIEAEVAEALRQRGHVVIPGGAPYPEEDKLATTAPLAREHVHTVIDFHPQAVMLNVSAGAEPALIEETVRYLAREAEDVVRLLVWADLARRPKAAPDLALGRERVAAAGFPSIASVSTAAGNIEGLAADVALLFAMADREADALRALNRVIRARGFVLGPTFSRESGSVAAFTTLARVFGLGFVHASIEELRRRLELMGADGAAAPRDPRLQGSSDPVRAAAQAIQDLAREQDADFAVLNGLGEHAGPIVAALGADTGQAGEPKESLPAAQGADAGLAVVALLAREIFRRPADVVRLDEVDGKAARFRAGRPCTAEVATLASLKETRAGLQLEITECRVVPARSADGFITLEAAGHPWHQSAHATAVLTEGGNAAAFLELARARGLGTRARLNSGDVVAWEAAHGR